MGEPLADQVAVVTGGGGGIGSAVAVGLARQGAAVVVMDPGVGVEGQPLHEPTAEATAARIRAAGGTAVASTASVTDHDELGTAFEAVHRQFGRLDIVVNTAGILRPSRLPEATEDDWRAVFDVHLGGYLNVLAVALPAMVSAGHGRVIGCTSGVGLARTTGDGNAYGPAKRAVAAITWQVGRRLPPGVTVNALSPIAATRMVRRTLEPAAGGGPPGLDLSAMPQPAEMAPVTAYLAGARAGWCSGQVVFSAGSELSLITPPQLLEAVRTEGVADLPAALATAIPVLLAPAEAQQATTGGSNPRIADVFSRPDAAARPAAAGTPSRCLVVADDPALGAAVSEGVRPWGLTPVGPDGADPAAGASALPAGFAAVGASLQRATAGRPLDAVVVALTAPRAASGDLQDWQPYVDAQIATAPLLLAHAGWLRAAVRHLLGSRAPLRVVLVTVGGRDLAATPAAQAVAQLARSANEMVLPAPLDVCSLSVESDRGAEAQTVGPLVGRLVAADDAVGLRGAELVVGPGWVGARSHPRPVTTVTFGGGAIPDFVDGVLRQAVRG